MNPPKPKGVQAILDVLLHDADKGEPQKGTLYFRGIVVSGTLMSFHSYQAEIMIEPTEDEITNPLTDKEQIEIKSIAQFYGRRRGQFAANIDTGYNTIVIKNALVLVGEREHLTHVWYGNFDAVEGLEYGLHYLHPDSDYSKQQLKENEKRKS